MTITFGLCLCLLGLGFSMALMPPHAFRNSKGPILHQSFRSRERIMMQQSLLGGGNGTSMADPAVRVAVLEQNIGSIAATLIRIEKSIAKVETSLKADIADFKTDLKADIANVKTDLKTDIGNLSTRIDNVNTKIEKLDSKYFWTSGGLAALMMGLAAFTSSLPKR